MNFVPPGDLVVKLWNRRELIAQRVVTIAPGEKKEVAFE